MAKGTLQQILLLTDGCSNSGEDPVQVAADAYQSGIIVNVIGIMSDRHKERPKGLDEVERIAQAGGGVSRIVYPKALTETVQMVTRQAMTHTIQAFLNEELQQILGQDKEVEDLEPEARGEVMELVEDYGETCALKLAILVDTSASMEAKLETVKEALLDLSLSLTARIGDSTFCLNRFPGSYGGAEELLNWSPHLKEIQTIFPKLSCGGVTPTGPALQTAIAAFNRMHLTERLHEDAEFIEEA